MQTIADGWNAGHARTAADCFSAEAIYVEPPDKQLYRGRAALYEFFGIVVVKIEAGALKYWREYQYPTELDWEEFTSQNCF